MHQWLEQIVETTGGAGISLWRSAGLLGHAILIGLYLMFLNYSVSRKIGSSGEKADSEAFIASATVLFVCVGMSAVMILVNDNLARAFAIGAAISLIRFRVKMGGKFFGIALLYAVLTGMACGLGRADIGWSVAIVFGILLGFILKVHNRAAGRLEAKEQTDDHR